MKRIKSLLLGFIAGLFSSALGIGGGVCLVPGLMFLMGYKIKRAIGTSLIAIVPAVFVGIIAHYFIQPGNVKPLIALFVIVGSVIGARCGATLVNKIDSKKLTKLFALLLLFVGLRLTGIIRMPFDPVSTGAIYPWLVVLGLGSGLVSSLFGIGGGIITVPGLYFFFGLTMIQTVSTSLVVVLFTTFAGAMFHRKFNNIDIGLMRFLVPAALVGAVIGAIVANLLPAHTLKIILGVIVVLCSVRFWR